MARELTFFRVYGMNENAFKSMPDETLGKALKKAMEYFDRHGEVTEEDFSFDDAIEQIAFGLLKRGIDDAYEAHSARIENSSKGGKKTQEKNRKQREEFIDKHLNGADD